MYTSPPIKWKVFIASSGKARRLAEALAAHFLNDGEVDPNPWFMDNFHVGGNTLEELTVAAKFSDFAAILLTKDDARTQLKDEKRLLDVPRDNCIFELGLFMGALGMNSKRCFMVSSVDEKALPSDLKGYTYEPFAQPKDLANREDCAAAMKPVYLKLIKEIWRAKKFDRPQIPLLSLDELLRRESATDLSPGSEVIVHAEKPHETKYLYARVVRDNMNRGITYHYFFDLEPIGAVEIVYLLRTLAVVDLELGDTDWEDMNERERLKILEDEKNQKPMEKSLEEIRKRLKIHMLPYKVSEAFCIHNAGTKKSPEKCYLRWIDDVNFIEIPDAAKAHTKYVAYEAFRHKQRTVFGVTSREIDKALGLGSLINENFPPSLRPIVRSICFPDKPKSSHKITRNQSGPLRRSSGSLTRTQHNGRH